MEDSDIQITLGTYGHLYAKSDYRIIDTSDVFQFYSNRRRKLIKLNEIL